mmetsp:Transcript_16822/g.25436  ORF Transcript_16822/g.25436 Transcript_16822/m.25436 type:complete len:325 (-) Transcript_16822:177-1151(-)
MDATEKKGYLADRIIECRVKRKSVTVLAQAIQTLLAILVLFYEKLVECSNSQSLTDSLEDQLAVVQLSSNNDTEALTETLSKVGNDFLIEQGQIFADLDWTSLESCFKYSVIRDSSELVNVNPTNNPSFIMFILFGIITALVAGLSVYIHGWRTEKNDDIETSVALENLYFRTSKVPFVDTILELPIATRYAPVTTVIIWGCFAILLVLGAITFFAEGSQVFLSVLLVVLSYLQLVGAICEYRVLTVYKEEEEEDDEDENEKLGEEIAKPKPPTRSTRSASIDNIYQDKKEWRTVPPMQHDETNDAVVQTRSPPDQIVDNDLSC